MTTLTCVVQVHMADSAWHWGVCMPRWNQSPGFSTIRYLFCLCLLHKLNENHISFSGIKIGCSLTTHSSDLRVSLNVALQLWPQLPKWQKIICKKITETLQIHKVNSPHLLCLFSLKSCNEATIIIYLKYFSWFFLYWKKNSVSGHFCLVVN